MRKVFTAVAGALLLGAGAAHATPISGTYSITDTGTGTITNVLSNPFTLNLTVGAPQTVTLINIHDTTAGTSTISASFVFTAPVAATGSNSGTDVFATLTGHNVNDTFTGSGPTVVNFSDGSILDLAFGSSAYGGTTQGAGGYNNVGLDAPFTFTLVQGPTTRNVPEPLTLSVFGAGLAGLGMLRRRKSRAA